MKATSIGGGGYRGVYHVDVEERRAESVVVLVENSRSLVVHQDGALVLAHAAPEKSAAVFIDNLRELYHPSPDPP